MRNSELKLNTKKLVLFSIAFALVCLTTSMTMLFAADFEPSVSVDTVKDVQQSYELVEMASLDADSIRQENKYRLDLMDDAAGEVGEIIAVNDIDPALIANNAEVPEPATAALIAAGALAMIMKRRRNRG